MAFKRIIDLPEDTAKADDEIVISSDGSGKLEKTDLQDIDISLFNNDSGFISAIQEDSSPVLGGNLDVSNNKLQNVDQVTNLSAPQNPDEAATKSYVDNTGVGAGTVPIGGIVPWFKDFTNVPSLPAEFAECNGQTISDAESPLDGQTLPDLNGSSGKNRFLRGDTTSGETGGSATNTHSHSIEVGTDSFESGGVEGVDSVGGNFEGSGDTRDTTIDTVPPYTDTVMVMRIK